MDLDRFLSVNRPVWDRLGLLTNRAGRGPGRLSAAELDEMVHLYQRAATHLSYVRTAYQDPALTARLTGLVAAAGAVVYGTRPRTLRAVGRFFTITFPAAVWHIRRPVLVSGLLTLAPAVALGLWLAHSPAAVSAVGPAAARQQYISKDFAQYYSSSPSVEFATRVFVNNVQVAILAFAAGILGCLLTAYVLATNGANLGVAAGLFAAAGRSGQFYGLVAPHGLLELSSVVIAGGAGLSLGWALIDPGDRPRARALGEDGRRAMAVVVGLVVCFGVAGTIEGFVTGSGLPTWARVGIGVMAEAALLTWVVLLGRGAASAGATGALGEEGGRRVVRRAGTWEPVSA